MSKKKMLMRKFGSVAVTNNTFIGGVASVINTPALLAAKLQNYPSGTAFNEADIHNFTIVGDDIECYIGVDYQILVNAFKNNALITYYIDYLSCKKIGATAFYALTTPMSIKYVYFKNVVTVETNAFQSDISPYGLKIADFPNAINFIGVRHFASNKLDSCNIPKVTNLGSTTASDEVFFYASFSKIYANPFLQTSNAGAEEGDIAYARGSVANIVYVQNFTPPNQITNLSIGTVYATAIQLNFTAPTGSTNAIDFYEVYNGNEYLGKVTASGQYITGLTPNTVYNIEVKPVDIYYNKSSSNIVTQLTAATLVYQDSLVSYYKMENNVLDSWGANNGTPTAITYASGLVGQTAVFNGSTSKITATKPSLETQISITLLVKNALHNNIEEAKSGFLFMNTENYNSHYPNVGDNVIYMSVLTSTRKTIGVGVISDRTVPHVVTITANTVTNVWKMYQNSTLVHTDTVGTLSLLANLTLGKSKDNFWYNGQQDEFAVFNKELTLAEVSEINTKLLSGQSLI